MIWRYQIRIPVQEIFSLKFLLMRKWTKRWRTRTTQVIPWSLADGRRQKWARAGKPKQELIPSLGSNGHKIFLPFFTRTKRVATDISLLAFWVWFWLYRNFCLQSHLPWKMIWSMFRPWLWLECLNRRPNLGSRYTYSGFMKAWHRPKANGTINFLVTFLSLNGVQFEPSVFFGAWKCTA